MGKSITELETRIAERKVRIKGQYISPPMSADVTPITSVLSYEL
jgi:hypothetical protein